MRKVLTAILLAFLLLLCGCKAALSTVNVQITNLTADGFYGTVLNTTDDFTQGDQIRVEYAKSLVHEENAFMEGATVAVGYIAGAKPANVEALTIQSISQ